MTTFSSTSSEVTVTITVEEELDILKSALDTYATAQLMDPTDTPATRRRHLLTLEMKRQLPENLKL